MATSVFTHAKRGVKAKAFDEYGNEVDFDVREDEEQNVKLQETADLLLAAGYFRARIKGLSPFDKVVGGMTWCITASNVEVDADLLFQENSTIGQKIALTEKIVAALPRMKCPHALEPHQIQGLDFIHIFPVVQWLVKKALETREERAAQIRSRALFEFGQHSETPEEAEFNATLSASVKAAQEAQGAYKPRRQFRAPAQKNADEMTRVQSTLLEYGRRYGLSRKPKATEEKDANKAAVAQSLGADEGEGEDLAAMEEARISSLMSGMAEAGEGAVASSDAIGSMIGAQSAAIAQLSEAYKAHAAEIAAAGEGRAGGAAAHKRAVASLKRQVEQTTASLEEAEKSRAEAKAAYDAAEAAVQEANAYADKLATEMARLDELEGDESNKPIIAKLRHLLLLHDGLRQQQEEFKASCQSEMESLTARIEQLKGNGVEHIDEERKRAVQQQYDEEAKRLQKARLAVARKNREAALFQRKMDAVPGRSELNQYQRRFMELSEQVNAKHRETKQHYTFYNTLDDTKRYMEKEDSLLNSIHDNFPRAMQSNGAKAQFLEQFQNIVSSITSNQTKLEERMEGEKITRDTLSEKYLKLVETERLYYKTVRDYEDEIKKNEKLQAKLGAK